MALLYEKREITLNFKQDKPTVYRIAPAKQQQVTFDKLLDEVSNSCGVNRAQVKAAVEALIDRMTLFMDYGMSVKLGDFGSFKPTFNAKAQQTTDDLGADNVRRKKIVFYPGKRFKNMLEKLSVSTMEAGEYTRKDDSGNSGGGDDGGGGWVDPTA